MAKKNNPDLLVINEAKPNKPSKAGNDNLLKNRFFTKDDPNQDTFIFKINPGWWSRPYEYLWASKFLEKGKAVLDVACGLSHPFRFVCEKITSNADACDLDGNISDINQTINAIRYQHGEKAVGVFNENLEDYKAIFDKSFRSDIKNITADPDSYDVVFCISALEHLDTEDIETALSEMSRVVKPDGLIVITLDVPSVDLDKFLAIVDKVGLKFASNDIDATIPDNAINQDYLGQNLKVFRCVLKK